LLKGGPEKMGNAVEKIVGKRQLINKSNHAQLVQESGDSDVDELTDLDDDNDLTPKRGRKGLKRSYAIANFATPVQTMKDKHEGQALDNDEYEPVTEPERYSGAEHDDDPTPKKKQKVVKVPVREAVNANREEPELHRRQSEVNKVSKGIMLTSHTTTIMITCLIRFVPRAYTSF
jgi:hypothetical protein